MHRSGDSIRTIAAALAKAQKGITNPHRMIGSRRTRWYGATCSAFWLVMRSILISRKKISRGGTE
jgi:hypothetical protein